ncbi:MULTISPECIES: DUF2625 family protein [Clostridium]|uniref:DUF2625 family protein n=1 Tax=Clostridium TaxID=1485 RepID=UPI001EEDDF5D|nr:MULTISPECIES: DUF2625 family protein [Clostridium]WRY51041.1 DUF2625 family protein [Clostridium intestinale]
MKLIHELISEDESAKKILLKWEDEAINKIEILHPCEENNEKVLLNLQVTTKSLLGAIAYNTGGIFIEYGWIRILGSGSNKINRDVSSWNGLNSNKKLNGALLVADDVLGGFFAINGGAFIGEMGNVFYLAPDTLEWEDLDLKFADFIYWTFTGDINKFYETFRWQGWKDEIGKITGDDGISVYPYLWAEDLDVEIRSRKRVPIEELWGITMEFRERFGLN